ncbi:NAD(P)-dependent oxidoreductase [Aquibacillus salsiterrae]|uniref:NAD(P)-dependent oxidoreductase n=1 Tax=Aquibacillus salsiterrae TaxID=2950439 RepID=A0A9X3WEY5_9BACI|nr:NAD(P)-dependent oxidoreductase [Aquibacillus salsiterrae]MDC3418557.1 NAD(P)-dependent oxidoreductase [Aquibacillus salsiterrae]
MATQKIGFIGLGAMGFPMARNLIENGFHVNIAVHRNRHPVDVLRDKGAMEYPTVAEIISHSDVIISILPTDKEMQAVLLSDSVLEQLSADKILIEMTSGSPDMMKKVNETYQAKGTRVLDAPVSGGTAGAEQGTLTVMTGGESGLLDEVRHVLDAMAKNIYLVGPIGAGKAIKAINQMLAGIHMIASAEAVSLAKKLNVDMESVREVIGNSSGASWMLMNKLDTLIDENYEPGFKLKLMRKDVQIAVDEGNTNVLPLGALALQLYKMAEKTDAEMDFAAISKYISN